VDIANVVTSTASERSGFSSSFGNEHHQQEETFD
jgi:hypothetical protein